MTTATDTRFVQVPAGLISSLRRALANDRQPLEAVNLLRQVANRGAPQPR